MFGNILEMKHMIMYIQVHNLVLSDTHACNMYMYTWYMYVWNNAVCINLHIVCLRSMCTNVVFLNFNQARGQAMEKIGTSMAMKIYCTDSEN